jgi:hypothetical protein
MTTTVRAVLFCVLLVIAGHACHTKRKAAGPLRYEGRLAEKGICKNYTLVVLSGKLDTSQVVPSWTNPASGKTHVRAFRLENPCQFPDSLQEGERFYFTLLSSPAPECMVCMAYYPTPAKSLSIQVVP